MFKKSSISRKEKNTHKNIASKMSQQKPESCCFSQKFKITKDPIVLNIVLCNYKLSWAAICRKSYGPLQRLQTWSHWNCTRGPADGTPAKRLPESSFMKGNCGLWLWAESQHGKDLTLTLFSPYHLLYTNDNRISKLKVSAAQLSVSQDVGSNCNLWSIVILQHCQISVIITGM